MNKNDVLKSLLDLKVVAVIRMTDAFRLSRVIESIERGGIKAHRDHHDRARRRRDHPFRGRLQNPGVLIGAGTVLDAATAAAVIDAGPISWFRRCSISPQSGPAAGAGIGGARRLHPNRDPKRLE